MTYPATTRSRIALAGFCLLVAASTLHADGDDSLVQLCRQHELAVPASCACTVAQARSQGVKESDLRSLLTDDGKKRPVSESTYVAFWQLKTKCIGEATMAGLPKPGTGLPPPITAPSATRQAGVGSSSRPGSTASAPSASGRTPIPSTADKVPTEDWGRVLYFTPDQTRTMLKSLEGTTWRMSYPEGFGGSFNISFGRDRKVTEEIGGIRYEYKAVVSDEPGFDHSSLGIHADRNGMWDIHAPRVKPYLMLQNAKNPKGGQEFWLGYWGGKDLWLVDEDGGKGYYYGTGKRLR